MVLTVSWSDPCPPTTCALVTCLIYVHHDITTKGKKYLHKYTLLNLFFVVFLLAQFSLHKHRTMMEQFIHRITLHLPDKMSLSRTKGLVWNNYVSVYLCCYRTSMMADNCKLAIYIICNELMIYSLFIERITFSENNC